MKEELFRPFVNSSVKSMKNCYYLFLFIILMIWYFTSLQVSDVEQIMGLVQAENIQVHAESYDVALDMSFPKGT